MLSNGFITPSSLSVKDLLWQIQWDKEKCTLCGRCAAVCPVQAIYALEELPEKWAHFAQVEVDWYAKRK